ncbi:hypothetical protein Tco_1317665 [Tanacetum coccineum]
MPASGVKLMGEAEVKAEFARQLDAQQKRSEERMLDFDERLNKMDKETKEEFALILYISAAIVDGMRQGLEVGIVHGRKGTDINSIPAYNPHAAEVYADNLNNSSFPLLGKLEACAEEKFSYIEALLVMRFIIAPSIPYVGDAGATAMESTMVEEIENVESDFQVLAGNVPNTTALASLASTPHASASDTSPLVVQNKAPFSNFHSILVIFVVL